MTRRKDWIDKDTPGRKPGSRNEWAVVRLCLRCRQPFWATRWDAISCSGKCRVWLHRHPEVLKAAYRIARGHFPVSRGEWDYGSDGTRYAVGQWLHYLVTREKDTVDMAWEAIARYGGDGSG